MYLDENFTDMKHISVLVPKGIVVLDTIIASYNLLLMANSYAKRLHGLNANPFKIDLVGLDTKTVFYQGNFSVKPSKDITAIERTDLIVVTANSGPMKRAIQQNQGFVPWIRSQRIKNDAEIASLCKGAFLLAETGLLNGKTCSTHWTAHDDFKQRYPEVKLVPESIISEDNGIYSSGGAYSFLNFMLFLIEKYFGRAVAIHCSKVSEIEFDRLDQSPFMIFSGQKDHQDKEVLSAQHYIEQNYAQAINVNKIAEEVKVGARTFLRRFKRATDNTPIEYVQRVRVEAAKKKFESSTMNVNEVMYSVGYLDEKAFRNVFRKYSGLSPLAYRKKYNREMALA